MAASVSPGECAKRWRPPSRFGQLRLTSTATTSFGAVILLQRAHAQFVTRPVRHAFGGGDRRRPGGETRDGVVLRGGADVIAVGARATAARAVDHEIDLAAGDEIDGVDTCGLS